MNMNWHIPIALCVLLALSACQTSASSGQTAIDSSADIGAGTVASQSANASNTEGALIINNSNETNEALQSAAFIPTRSMRTGALESTELSEVSGLAAASRYTNTLWAINDSGNTATLYAFDNTGKAKGNFSVAAQNRDWEDLAAATINGEPYLLIGDIGDNQRNKTEHTIHVVPEPLLNDTPAGELQPIHTLRFRYPNTQHNSESLSYADGYIYILTKEPLRNGGRQASKAFRIPLSLTQTETVLVAEQIATLAIPNNSLEASIIASVGGVDVSQPTAFEIDSQNRYAYVLTYRSVYRYERDLDQSWGDVLSQPRLRIHGHSLSQAEALAVDDAGVVWFTSEKRPAPLWAIPPASQ